MHGMNKKKIWLSAPSIGSLEIKLVSKALKENWISSIGKNYNRFKILLQKKIKGKYISLVNSGTSAIHLALKALNIKDGDIILCQSFTFIGSVNPIKYCNAIPVFIDSETDTWNLDPNRLEQAIRFFIKNNKKPKAIIVVHIYGMPCKIYEIKKIANHYKIPIIEDAAEAFGSKINQIYCGTFGEIGILSFNANKILTCGGGGALISKNRRIVEISDYFSSQAKSNRLHYHHTKIGYNYRLNNISASIGIGQLNNIDKKIKIYQENFNKYNKILSNYDFLKLKKIKTFNSDKIECNYWLIPVSFDEKILKKIKINRIINLFNKKNIEVRPVWKPVHTQPIYSNQNFFGSNLCNKIFSNSICLPNNIFLDNDYFTHLEFILNRIKKSL